MPACRVAEEESRGRKAGSAGMYKYVHKFIHALGFKDVEWEAVL